MRIMKAMAARPALALLSLVALGACGGSSSHKSLPAGYYITISSMRFSPLDLAVPPGATVTVLNDDSMDHTVTSEATSGAYTPGGVAGVSFDTGPFVGQRSFTIPSTAPEGTVIPYYCKVHTTTMATPSGGGGGGGGGGGY